MLLKNVKLIMSIDVNPVMEISDLEIFKYSKINSLFDFNSILFSKII